MATAGTAAAQGRGARSGTQRSSADPCPLTAVLETALHRSSVLVEEDVNYERSVSQSVSVFQDPLFCV